jgi:small-conductance mechanosensitive channel
MRCQSYEHGLGKKLKQLLPTFILVALAVLAGATDVFSEQVHQVMGSSFKEFFESAKPYIVRLLIAAVTVNIAWLCYHPLCCRINSMLNRAGASERSTDVTSKVVKLAYWALVSLFVMSFFSTDLMGKVVIGFSLFAAVAIKGSAEDFMRGVQLQFGKRLKKGDEVEIHGLPIAGKVVDVGYLETLIETPNGTSSLSNCDVWSHAITVKKKEQ